MSRKHYKKYVQSFTNRQFVKIDKAFKQLHYSILYHIEKFEGAEQKETNRIYLGNEFDENGNKVIYKEYSLSEPNYGYGRVKTNYAIETLRFLNLIKPAPTDYYKRTPVGMFLYKMYYVNYIKYFEYLSIMNSKDKLFDFYKSLVEENERDLNIRMAQFHLLSKSEKDAIFKSRKNTFTPIREQNKAQDRVVCPFCNNTFQRTVFGRHLKKIHHTQYDKTFEYKIIKKAGE